MGHFELLDLRQDARLWRLLVGRALWMELRTRLCIMHTSVAAPTHDPISPIYHRTSIPRGTGVSIRTGQSRVVFVYGKIKLKK